ncbi:MAG: thiol:disulfide interchange protein DsbD [Pseudohongiellaceae bacterium]|jgi:thiol:disulfide interchange protein DsbD
MPTRLLLNLTYRAINLFALSLLLLPQVLLAQLDGPSLSSFTDQNRSQWRPLPLEQAFPFYVSESEPGAYSIVWETAQEHYLYKHQFKFSLQQSSATSAQPVAFDMPQGIKKTDQFFGEVEVYYSKLTVDLSLPKKLHDGAILLIEFQGCAEWGFCYPAQEIQFEL